MCVVAIAWAAHPGWRLVLAGNRDEFHARPAAPIARWDDIPHMIAGQDLQSRGSWLGVSEAGRLAVVTNVRNDDGPDPSRISRGQLITDYLGGHGPYAALSLDQGGDFNPFNLLVATPHGAKLVTNQPVSTQVDLPPGVHSLSNGTLGEAWSRKDALEVGLADWLRTGTDDTAFLFDLLRREDTGDVPDNASLFIRGNVYGTRCSTVVTIDATGAGQITERRFERDGSCSGETHLRFAWRV
jgi:uncharacterized protein with NRDE domain